MGLTLLPRLIVLAHWNAGFFDALAVVLEDERARQLTHGSTIREFVVTNGAEVVPANPEPNRNG